MDYMGIFVERTDPPVQPITGNDDGFHCSTCEREKAVDDHVCNECSRKWGLTRCQIHANWSPNGVRDINIDKLPKFAKYEILPECYNVVTVRACNR